MTWLDDEQHLLAVAHQQVRRMVSRARRRPLVTLSVTLVLAAMLLGLQIRRPKVYAAEVGLLITEGAFAADGRPRPRGELRAFINGAVFATARLTGLISKHNLVKRLGGGGQTDTLALMRDLIEVETFQDYFEDYRSTADPPRSARVMIAFSAPDPELALAVARDLGELVAETQMAREADAADAQVATQLVVAEAATSRAADLMERCERMSRAALNRPGGLLGAHQDGLLRELLAAENAAKVATEKLVDAQLRAHAARSVGGMVQVVDPGLPIWNAVPRRQRLVRQAALSLLLAGFLALFLVGAFDPTVLDEQDLRHAGLRPLGTVSVSRSHSSRIGV